MFWNRKCRKKDNQEKIDKCFTELDKHMEALQSNMLEYGSLLLHLLAYSIDYHKKRGKPTNE